MDQPTRTPARRVPAFHVTPGNARKCGWTPLKQAEFIGERGSITVDGVSLTVNAVEDEASGDCIFGLNIIPHTGEVTTLGTLSEGDGVNLEIDVLARYLKRMESLRG